MKAQYEILRVAREAVIMIKPNDQTIVHGGVAVLSRVLKDIVKRLLGCPMDYPKFEISGNYAYAISRREMEKVELGMGLQILPFMGINDYYLQGGEFEPTDRANRLCRKIVGKIARFDFLCNIGISQPVLLAVGLFKRSPTNDLRASLTRQSFHMVDLPRNPHLEADFAMKNATATVAGESGNA